MVLLLRKLYLYFTKDPEGVHYFPGGEVSNFFQGGPNANFFRNPCTYWLFSRGGGVRNPYPPLDPHMGNHHNVSIFITVPLHNCQALICQD